MTVGTPEFPSPQINPKTTNNRFGLNPETAARIHSELSEIDKKGPKKAPESPILAAAKKSYDYLESLKQKIAKIETRAKDAEKKVFMDGLTGLYNRDYLDKTINSFNSERDHNNLGVVFIDLNFLKKTNDSKGHAVGDMLIKHTADILKKVFRSGDILSYVKNDESIESTNSPKDTVPTSLEKEISPKKSKKDHLISRRGGDEFIVLCHNSTNQPNFKDIFTEVISRRLSEAISNYNQNKDKDEETRKYPFLSIAFGTAVYNKEIDPDGLLQTISRSEEAMYLHKKAIHASRD